MKTDKLIAVAGATGQQGGATTRHLLERGFRVRALTRDPNSASSLKLQAAGAEVVAVDLAKPEPYLAIVSKMNAIMDEMEQLLDEKNN